MTPASTPASTAAVARADSSGHSHLARARTLLRLPAHRRVASLLAGEYLALTPGRSTEFTDLREYVPGDDPRDLDWKASARARSLLVRRYDALRKLTVVLVVPTGRSLRAASPSGEAKHEVALAAAGVLGHLVVGHGDLLGLVHGDSADQTVLPPRGGVAHAEACLRSAGAAARSADGPPGLAAVLRRVAGSLRRRATVVVVADPVEADHDVAAALRRLRARHEVLLVVVDALDPATADPDRPVLDVADDGAVPAWLRDDEALRREMADLVDADRRRLSAELDRLRVPHVTVGGTDDVVPALRRLLERHACDRRR